MANSLRDRDLIDMIQYMGEAAHEAHKTIDNLHRYETELKKKVFLAEAAQRIHEKIHRICGIAAQPPITDLARDQIQPENARLKALVKGYREKLGEALPEDY